MVALRTSSAFSTSSFVGSIQVVLKSQKTQSQCLPLQIVPTNSCDELHNNKQVSLAFCPRSSTRMLLKPRIQLTVFISSIVTFYLNASLWLWTIYLIVAIPSCKLGKHILLNE